MVCVVWWYRRDSHEQLRPVGWALLILRLVVFIGLILYFFQLDKRSELRVTRNSRVAVLVDTSLSMTLPGTPTAIGATSNMSRIEEAVRLVASSPVLDELSKQHDVTLYRFDQLTRPIQVASLAKPTVIATANANQGANAGFLKLSRAHTLLWAACIIGSIALILIAVSFGSQIAGARSWSGGAWSLLSGSLLALLAMVLLAIAILPVSDYPFAALFMDPEAAASRFEEPTDDLGLPSSRQTGAEPNAVNTAATSTQVPSDWGQTNGD